MTVIAMKKRVIDELPPIKAPDGTEWPDTLANDAFYADCGLELGRTDVTAAYLHALVDIIDDFAQALEQDLSGHSRLCSEYITVGQAQQALAAGRFELVWTFIHDSLLVLTRLAVLLRAGSAAPHLKLVKPKRRGRRRKADAMEIFLDRLRLKKTEAAIQESMSKHQHSRSTAFRALQRERKARKSQK
jgi:hypothetical protein